jgi:hypothetical protein
MPKYKSKLSFDNKELMPIVDPIMDYLQDSEYFKKQYKSLNTDQQINLMEDLLFVAIDIKLLKT